MHLPLYFKKYDPETERYGVATAIRFCFPFKPVDPLQSCGVDSISLDDNNHTIDITSSSSSASSSASSSVSILSKGHIEDLVRKSTIDTKNGVTVECHEKKIFSDIYDNNEDQHKSEIKNKQERKEKKAAELRAFKTIELLLLEMYFIIKESFSRTNLQNSCEKDTNDIINEEVNKSCDNDNSDDNSKSIFSDIMKKATIGRRQMDITVSDIKMDDLYSLLKTSER